MTRFYPNPPAGGHADRLVHKSQVTPFAPFYPRKRHSQLWLLDGTLLFFVLCVFLTHPRIVQLTLKTTGTVGSRVLSLFVPSKSELWMSLLTG